MRFCQLWVIFLHCAKYRMKCKWKKEDCLLLAPNHMDVRICMLLSCACWPFYLHASCRKTYPAIHSGNVLVKHNMRLCLCTEMGEIHREYWKLHNIRGTSEEQSQGVCFCIAAYQVLSMLLPVFIYKIWVKYFKYPVVGYCICILSSNFNTNRCLAGPVPYNWMAQSSFLGRKNSYGSI